MEDATLERPSWLPGSPLSMSEASRMIGRAPNTVWKWIRDGVSGRAGLRVKLQAVRLGGQWVTTLEWLREFFEACNGGELPTTETPDAVKRRASREQKAAREALGGTE